MASTSSDQLVLAYRSTSSVEVRSLAAQLDEAAIETRIIGDFLDGAGLDIGGMSVKELWVAQSDWPQVEPLILAWRQEHHPQDVAANPTPGGSLEIWGWLAVLCLALIAGGRAMGVENFRTLFGLLLLGFVLVVSIIGVRKLMRQAHAADHEETAQPGKDE